MDIVMVPFHDYKKWIKEGFRTRDSHLYQHFEQREDINKIIDNLREDNQIDRELYRDTIDKFDSKLDKFAIALENNNNELGVIKEDIRNIKEKVGV